MARGDRHPLYVEATGDDDWEVTVRWCEDLEDLEYDAVDLVKLHRANVFTRQRGSMRVLVVQTRLTGVVDFEHDTSKLFHMEVSLPVETLDAGYRRVMVGTLTDFRAYPEGVDPFAVEDGDTHADPEPGSCGYEGHTCRLAPYMPPQRHETRKLLDGYVEVSYGPRRQRPVSHEDADLVMAVATRWFDQDPDHWREDGTDGPDDLRKDVRQVLRCLAEELAGEED